MVKPSKATKLFISKKPKTTKPLIIFLIVALIALVVVYSLKMFNVKELFAGDDAQSASAGKKYFVKLIYSDTCPHCLTFKPTFDKVAQKGNPAFAGRDVTFSKLAASDAAAYSSYVSNGIPAVLFMTGADAPSNVNKEQSLVGNMSEAEFVTKVLERTQ
jgi:thiol-disulfide isomerase/thioredoxin